MSLSEIINLQKIATNSDNSCWVFASAGSGKTKILTDRVILMLLEGIEASKILCLTYTKVAAIEMQNRINEKLANWAIIDEEKLIAEIEKISHRKINSQIIKRARSLFAFNLDFETKLKIQTIHSFCQSLVKIFPFETQTSPNFEILEENQEKQLLQIAQKTILENCHNPQLANSIKKISEFISEENLTDLFSELLKNKDRLIFIKENNFSINQLIDQIYLSFELDRNCSEEEIFNNFLAKIDQNKLKQIHQSLINSDSIKDKQSGDKIAKFLTNQSFDNFSSLQSAFLTNDKTLRKFSKKIKEDDDLTTIIDENFALIKSFLNQLQSYQICQKTQHFLILSEAILNEYNKIKKSQNYIDYADLIIKTNLLLNNSDFADWVKKRMDSFYNHILIDESQDTNYQQFQIIKAITEDFFSGETASEQKRSLFIVGDEKQSIYSFQGAEIEIFDEIFNHFDNKLKNIGQKLIKIELNNSFRSLPNILEAVDLTFGDQDKKKAISKISDFNRHIAIREGEGYVEVWPLIDFKKDDKKQSQNDLEKENQEKKHKDNQSDVNQDQIDFSQLQNPVVNYDEKEFLAENIALFIKNYVAEKKLINSRREMINYSDFMILLRKRNSKFDKSLQNYFKKYHIPFCGKNRIKFSQNIIIQDILALAKSALFDYDDLNLAAVLKSKIFNLSEQDLLKICQIKNEQKITLFQALELSQNDDKKLQNCYQKLSEIKKFSKQNCYQFFCQIIDKEVKNNYYQSYGEQAKEIFDSFLIKIFNFYRNQNFSLLQLIDFSEKTDPEISLSIDQKNAVLISTIHSAKGLQAPIVIIADSNFNYAKLMTGKEKISWMKFENIDFALPILSSFSDFSENEQIKNFKKYRRNLAYQENLRLLYVAMTRAEDELYITGFNKIEQDGWYNIIKKELTNSYQNCDEKKQSKVNEIDFFNSYNLSTKEKLDNLTINKDEINSAKILTFGKRKFENFAENQNKNNAKINSIVAKNLAQKELNFNILSPDLKSDHNRNVAQIRGEIIHKILEFLIKSNIKNSSQLKIFSRNILNNFFNIDDGEKNYILSLLEKFIDSEIFFQIISNKNIAEAEIMINKNNQKLLKRVDLIIEKNDQILIFDYKTEDKKNNQMSEKYRLQLLDYADSLAKIYPEKLVKPAIIWLNNLEIEFVD